MAKVSYTTELIAALKKRELNQALDVVAGEVSSARLVTNRKGTVCLEVDVIGKATGFTFEGKSVEVVGSCRIYNISLTKALLNAAISTNNDESTLVVGTDGSVTVKAAAAAIKDSPNPANPII